MLIGQGFELLKDDNGRFDVYMPFKSISLTSGIKLLTQTIESVFQTNKSEWQYDTEEGIDFKQILIKNPNLDIIKNEIRQAIYKIDDTLEMTDFSYTINKTNRHADICVKFQTSDGDNFVLNSTIH